MIMLLIPSTLVCRPLYAVPPYVSPLPCSLASDAAAVSPTPNACPRGRLFCSALQCMTSCPMRPASEASSKRTAPATSCLPGSLLFLPCQRLPARLHVALLCPVPCVVNLPLQSCHGCMPRPSRLLRLGRCTLRLMAGLPRLDLALAAARRRAAWAACLLPIPWNATGCLHVWDGSKLATYTFTRHSTSSTAGWPAVGTKM